jgi:hypothetical protein
VLDPPHLPLAGAAQEPGSGPRAFTTCGTPSQAANLQRGVSLADIAEVLGHGSTSITKRYSHLCGTHAERVHAAMNSIELSPTLDPNRTQLRLVRSL